MEMYLLVIVKKVEVVLFREQLHSMY